MKQLKKDNLVLKLYDTREEMGEGAGKDIHDCILSLLKEKDEINIIFAAAPSQNDTLYSLSKYDDIPWEKVNAFHMDEYVGLPKNAEERFSKYLDTHIFGLKNFKSVNYIDPSNSIENECARYTELLKKYPTDICILGIGENGHIAFNDPDVADFNDSVYIKAAKLDDICRNQQVNDGCFPSIDKVPTHALTLTIPTLIRSTYMFCSVPCKTKAFAVNETMTAEISEKCPATAMRNHKHAIMYCDRDAGSMLK